MALRLNEGLGRVGGARQYGRRQSMKCGEAGRSSKRPTMYWTLPEASKRHRHPAVSAAGRAACRSDVIESQSGNETKGSLDSSGRPGRRHTLTIQTARSATNLLIVQAARSAGKQLTTQAARSAIQALLWRQRIGRRTMVCLRRHRSERRLASLSFCVGLTCFRRH